MSDLRAVLVDDEQLAREELGFLLGQIGGIEIIGQADNGPDAVRRSIASSPTCLSRRRCQGSRVRSGTPHARPRGADADRL
jgi:hypothetical protein